jgi:molecular chaperone HtpG
LPTKTKLPSLLRFASSTTDAVSVSFADYKARMKEGQEAIYYITADTLAAAKNSPQLEVFKKKGIEVLLMTDRVDEWALNYVHEFDGTPLQSVAKGAVDLGKLQDEDREEGGRRSGRNLQAHAGQAQRSAERQGRRRARHHPPGRQPACLVVQDHGMSTNWPACSNKPARKRPMCKPVLEVNAEHPLVKKLDGSVHFQ